jgi:transcription antitermination protein NusB
MAGTTTSNNSFSEDEDFYHASAPGSRRRGREIALQGLYALELSGEPVAKVLRDVLSFHEEDAVIRDFARNVVLKATEHHDELDGHIQRHVTNWDFDRIAIIDRIILRMAICEFLYFFDIPPKVSIDEAIEMSKLYSTDQSGRFVNGILDSVLLDLKKSGQLVKSGRGLQNGAPGEK